MNNKRRAFLKNASSLAVSMCLPMSFISTKVNAAIPSNPKKLIVLTLMGGNDGINMAIPIDATQNALYQLLRTTPSGVNDIAIPLSETLPFGFDAGGIEFGLHPAMANLIPLKDKLALFPSTHMGVNSNRSHFLQHDLYDAGLHTDDGTTNVDQKGWLGRYFDTKYQSVVPEGVIAQDFAVGQLALMKGQTFTLGLANPSNIDLGAGSEAASDMIWQDIKGLNDPTATNYQGLYAGEQDKLFKVFDRLKGVNFAPPTAAYPTMNNGNLTGLASDFSRAASMIKQLPEVEVIHILQGGYDTHNKQGGSTGSQANLFANLADTLAAFYDDLGLFQNDVVVITQTEFGRTAKQNENGGTDHGQASCWMAFGGPVKGGVYGSYPGLETANMDSGRYLKPTIDYRDIFSEVLGAKHLGSASPNSVFPNYGGATIPLDFLI
ncbi:MAG: DUF1501 domain-containing protein [Pseudomonadota bacterium]